MDSKPSAEPLPGPQRPPVPVKIVIAGGFGVGKTTAVSAISEIVPLTTEAAITSVAAEIDRTGAVPAKVSTTVALDFGCITIDDGLKLYLFGTPGQDRFGFMWHDLSYGALGALVVVDARRIDDCYPAIDYFEKVGLPFVIAVNLFDGELTHDLTDLRWALAIDATTRSSPSTHATGCPYATRCSRCYGTPWPGPTPRSPGAEPGRPGRSGTVRDAGVGPGPGSPPDTRYLPPQSFGKPAICWQPQSGKKSGGMPGRT